MALNCQLRKRLDDLRLAVDWLTEGYGVQMPANTTIGPPNELDIARKNAVSRQLERMFASPAFAGSKRAQVFLRIIV